MKADKELAAKWLWACIGSGLDVGLTVEDMLKLLTPKTIRAVAQIAAPHTINRKSGTA